MRRLANKVRLTICVKEKYICQREKEKYPKRHREIILFENLVRFFQISIYEGVILTLL